MIRLHLLKTKQNENQPSTHLDISWVVAVCATTVAVLAQLLQWLLGQLLGSTASSLEWF